MKTNKSYTKRIKVTKNGSLKARKTGQNHFNAKESRVGRLKRRKPQSVKLSTKAQARFLSHG